jgi:hypothetical protein
VTGSLREALHTVGPAMREGLGGVARSPAVSASRPSRTASRRADRRTVFFSAATALAAPPAPTPDEGGLAVESVDDDQAVLTTDNSCSFS